MKRIFALAIVVILALATISPALAQETYDGRFTFEVPEGYTQSQGSTDTVTLTGESSRIIVVGPESYASVIGSEEFADDEAELSFFLDRAGYDLEAMMGMMDGPMNGLASVGIVLPRRNEGGNAWLVDLENGRRGVVISLHSEDMTMDESGTQAVLESLVYPADVEDVVAANEDLSTLWAAVEAAGLAGTLRDGDYTVFAPTNEAFEALLADMEMSAEDLLAETALLEQVLAYHVVEGVAMLPDAELTTLNGQTLATSFSLADGVNVIEANIQAYNGVIHIIDTVLLPEIEIPEEESGD